MRLVLDTNVLVSALLTPAGPPSRVLELILTQRAQALVDERILAEYREVLGRQKLKLDPSKVTIALDFFDTYAEKVSAARSIFSTFLIPTISPSSRCPLAAGRTHL